MRSDRRGGLRMGGEVEMDEELSTGRDDVVSVGLREGEDMYELYCGEREA